MVKDTIERKGKVLIPELGLGHAQETILRVEEAIRQGELPKRANVYRRYDLGHQCNSYSLS